MKGGQNKIQRNGGRLFGNSIKEMLLNYEIAPENIAGIGVDGQSWSAVAVDKNGHVLLNTADLDGYKGGGYM